MRTAWDYQELSSIAHPQENGQVEAVNKMLKDTLKKRLEEAKGAWPEQFPEVLWSYRTSHRTATGHTPFSLAYGYEAMFPVELDPLSHRRITYDQGSNSQLLMESLDLIDEKREQAQLRVAAYQQKVARYFNSKERERKFNVRDLVLRGVFLNIRDQTAGVLGPNWEGPYQIEEFLHPGTYKLARLNGNLIPRYCNGEHLRKYYH